MNRKSYKAIAKYYDAENERHEMLQQDVPFFLAHLPRRTQKVLELAVGTGRAAIPIAQAGHRVVGIDYDPAMLEIARSKRDSVGLTDRQLRLLSGDALRFDLGESFGWIAVFFNTFLAFTSTEQQDMVLQNLRRHLRSGGRLWIDVFQPNLALLMAEKSTGLEPGTFYLPELGRTVFRTTDIRRGAAEQVQQVTFNYRWFDAKARLHVEKTEFDLTYIFPREMRLLLERNGYAIEAMYGNYDGSIITSESPRMITCCKLA